MMGANGVGEGFVAILFEESDQALVDLADELGALVDHAGDELDQTGAVFDFLVGIIGVEDAADSDDGNFGFDIFCR